MPSRFELANAIRALSMDAVQKANSGHPGAPMGMADIAEVLWNDYLKHNPADPAWPDRDRFVLSNGHGSMLLYALLHLTGYDLDLEQLQAFRQLHSKTAGHPEFGYAPGIETTTGPLGQGLANAVGMALAEKTLAAQFNRPGHTIVDHHTWCFVGDGCLMEGISHEACSLAGVLGLGKLTVFYDDNGISIDGEVAGWFRDDTPARFASYGWHVVPGVDGHDPVAVATAIREALAETGRPSLICCRTVIGYGAPGKGNTAEAHGAPLGAEEVAATRRALGWPHPPFEVPEAVRSAWDARRRGLFCARDVIGACPLYSTMAGVCFQWASDIPQLAATATVDLAPSILWVTFTFAAILALNRAFHIELENQALDGLLLAPVSRGSIYLGKLLANLVFVATVEVLGVPLLALFFNVRVLPYVVPLAAIIALATVGFVAVGTLFSAMTVRTRFAELLLPVLLLPFMLPPLSWATLATGRLLAGRPLSEILGWLNMLAVYDVVFVTLALLLFPATVSE